MIEYTPQMTAAKTIGIALLIIVGGAALVAGTLLLVLFVLGVVAKINPIFGFAFAIMCMAVFNIITGRGPRHFT